MKLCFEKKCLWFRNWSDWIIQYTQNVVSSHWHPQKRGRNHLYYTVNSRYLAVFFSKKKLKKALIARPEWRSMACLFWLHNLALFPSYCAQNRAVFCRDTSRVYSIMKIDLCVMMGDNDGHGDDDDDDTIITLTSQWARWRLKSPASGLFTQLFIQVHIKENIKAPRHWPLCGEFTGDRWILRTKGQWRGKCLHLMTSSWCFYIALDVVDFEMMT